MKILLCLYTCEADSHALEALEKTEFLQAARSSSRIDVVTVTADHSLSVSRVEPTRIIVPCPEEYGYLSVKTHLMVKAALSRPFDFLVKVDATLATYSARPHSKSQALLDRLSPEAAARALRGDRLLKQAYSGLYQQVADREGFEYWLRMKGLAGDYRAVFPAGERTPPYFLGKLYSLRRDFCEFIAGEGSAMALAHQRWLGGSEDLMVGRLHHQWLQARRRPSGVIRWALSLLRRHA